MGHTQKLQSRLRRAISAGAAPASQACQACAAVQQVVTKSRVRHAHRPPSPLLALCVVPRWAKPWRKRNCRAVARASPAVGLASPLPSPPPKPWGYKVFFLSFFSRCSFSSPALTAAPVPGHIELRVPRAHDTSAWHAAPMCPTMGGGEGASLLPYFEKGCRVGRAYGEGRRLGRVCLFGVLWS